MPVVATSITADTPALALPANSAIARGTRNANSPLGSADAIVLLPA
jgi:hypothetical protein